MSCDPSRASYDVDVTYRGSLRVIKRSETYLGYISDYISLGVKAPEYPRPQEYLTVGKSA
jgi:hypothetical protein